MGTRSRLIFLRRRSGKKPVYLWMHWDGYFSGVGVWLCKEFKTLMEKYSLPEIKAMIDALDLKDNVDGQDFKTADLIPFLEGKIAYENDPCDDIEYEYTFDIDQGTFVGTGHGETRMLWVDQIRAGKNFDSEPEEHERERVSDKVNVVVEMVCAALKTLGEEEKRIAIGKIIKDTR